MIKKGIWIVRIQSVSTKKYQPNSKVGAFGQVIKKSYYNGWTVKFYCTCMLKKPYLPLSETCYMGEIKPISEEEAEKLIANHVCAVENQVTIS